jgi:UDP-glucose 4-epimerase
LKTYLITGVAGFIGSAIAKRILENGDEVIGIDNFLTGYRRKILEKINFIEGDISKKEDIHKLRDFEIDGIFHLAAQSSGEISYEKPEYDIQTNALGTLNLLNFAVEQNIKRFIYASSMSVYGDVEEKPISETDCKNPKSYYGITKLAGENYVSAFSDRLDTTSFRLFNVYGEGQNMQNMKQGMVSIYLAYFLKNEPVFVKGSGERFRDIIHIDDVVDIWFESINKKDSFGKIYNLGTGKKTKVKELLEILAKNWGDEKYPIEYADHGTSGDTFGIYADISKLKEDFWKPKIDLETGTNKFINWIKNEKLHQKDI